MGSRYDQQILILLEFAILSPIQILNNYEFYW